MRPLSGDSRCRFRMVSIFASCWQGNLCANLPELPSDTEATRKLVDPSEQPFFLIVISSPGLAKAVFNTIEHKDVPVNDIQQV